MHIYAKLVQQFRSFIGPHKVLRSASEMKVSGPGTAKKVTMKSEREYEHQA